MLRANMKKQENLNALDRALLRVSAPIEYGAATLSRGISSIASHYVYLVDTKKDNERLSYDNARLRENVHRLEQAQTENQDLRRLLQLRENTPRDTISARGGRKDVKEIL